MAYDQYGNWVPDEGYDDSGDYDQPETTIPNNWWDLIDNPVEQDENYSNEGKNNPTPTTSEDNQSIIQKLLNGVYSVSGSNILNSAGQIISDLYSNGALGQIVTAMLNNNQLEDNKDKLARFEQAAVGDLKDISNQIGSLPLPDLEALAKARPDLLPLIQQAKSEYDKINVDPSAMAASKESLAQLGNIATDGYGPIERAAAAKVLGQMATANRGQQEAIKSDLASRGQYGVGQEMTARMLAGQAEANRASQEGLEIESQAAKRALDAIRDKGKLGMDINQQEFNQQAEAAKAQDVINAFNANMGQKVNEANLAQQNLQQQRQLEQRQKEYQNMLDQQKAKQAAATAAGSNAAGMYNQQQKLVGTQLESRNELLGNLLTPKQANAPVTVNVSGQTGQTTAGSGTSTPASTNSSSLNNALNTGKAIVDGVSTGKKLYDAGKSLWDWISDEDEKTSKKTLSDDEIGSILDGLAPMEYKYKGRAVNNGAPKGKVVGITAQQIERTPAKGMVKDIEGVKHVDGQKAIQSALASLGSLHNRVKRMEGK